MEAVELLRLGERLLKLMSEHDIKVTNKMYSDHAETIAKVFGKTLQEISTETMVKAMHSMAIDTLKDKDKVYSIRTYFGL